MRTTIQLWTLLLSLTASSSLQAAPAKDQAASHKSQTGPLRYPQRLIDEQRVDLTPLFHWWTNQQGDRPLTAWVHITGSVLGTSAWGWVVQGHVEEAQPKKDGKETKPGTQVKILLKNPPAQEKTAFDNLKAQLASLEQQQTQLNAVETKAKAEAQKRTRGRHNRAAAAESRQARQVENETKNDLKTLNQQIEALKTQLAAYPSPDHYTVDCLALQTNELLDGQRIYDHGSVLTIVPVATAKH